MKKLNKFETAYVECLLWSSCDDNDTPLDKNYGQQDLADETIQKIKKDCEAFQDEAGELLDDLSFEQAGHDFWLTRNHHGTGFWDRDLEHGEALTELSHKYGEQWPYVGDDGKIYLG